MQEMLLAFRDVVQRAEMFAHHHVQRERLSVRVRMSDILATLEQSSFVEFVQLFKPEEGRMGVTVTFVAILELVREGLIDIVQTEAYAPLHVRGAQGARGLRLAVDNDSLEGDAVAGPTGELDVEGAADESVIDASFHEEEAEGPGPGSEQTDGDQHE
jgi:segregation and condensation protein A